MRRAGIPVVLAVLAVLPLPAAHAQERWFLYSRYGECADVASLKRKVPDLGEINDPDTFAALMRQKGHKVTMNPVGVPQGKAITVLVPERDLSLIFATNEVCGRSAAR